ncbi:Baculoviral IAP repeat-containing protein 2 [Branchiostoma belcheri]|nr:Baculoviral IAP repeat-containing protein 2 [Branchiostoma belcheri]
MGYNPDMVQKAVERHLGEHGRGFTTKCELVTLLDLMEEEEDSRRSQMRNRDLLDFLQDQMRQSEVVSGLRDLHHLQFPRSLAREMQSEVVSDVLKMGYRRHRVRKAVKQRLREHGRGFTSRDELLHAIMVLKEKEKRLKGMEMLSEALRHLQSRLDVEMQSQVVSDPWLGTPQVHKRHIDPREQYKSEQRRLASFATWPAGAPMQPREPAKAGSFPHSFPVSVFKMAEAGFYYSGTGDRVVCFSCGGSVEGWEFGDTAMGKHKRLHPHCNFVNGRCSQDQSPKQHQGHQDQCSKQHQGHQDQCSKQHHRHQDQSPKQHQGHQDQCSKQHQGLQDQCSKQHHRHQDQCSKQHQGHQDQCSKQHQGLQDQCSKQHQGHQDQCSKQHQGHQDQCSKQHQGHQDQCSKQHQGHQDQCSKQHQGLQDHVTHEDNVKCFYCGGRLRNWEPGDKPWTEHAKWCKFLLQERGDDYVLARFPKLQAQQQHMRPPDKAGTVHGHGKGGLPFQNSLDVQMQSWVVSGDATYLEDLEYVGERIRMCKVWMKAKVHTAFIPCGHHNVSVCIYSSYCTLPPGLSTKCANGTKECPFSTIPPLP